MAQKVQVIVTDDLDGTEGAQTVQFGLDGRVYDIDLSEGNEKEFREFLERYVSVARRVGNTGRAAGQVRRSSSSSSTGSGVDNAAVKEWARKEGLEVKDRGRIPARIVEAYTAAHA
jgi:hypothetical protein